MGSLPPACSTRSITSTACCSSTISPSSSATAWSRNSPRPPSARRKRPEALARRAGRGGNCAVRRGRERLNQSAEWATALDQLQICNVRRTWAFALDLGEWDTLRACFHPGAKVTVSWYAGPVEGFIERSKEMASARKPEEHRKHWLGNMRSEVVGARAVLETDVMILIREVIGGSLFGYTSS